MAHRSFPAFFSLPPLTARQPPFLPVTEREQRRLGIDQFDIILVSGDAYVDHPSFGTALLGRTLTGAGYSVGVIPQPNISDPDSFLVLGTPRLFFSISSGSVDSMVNHYTPSKKRRSEDAYSPEGRHLRPDRAVLVYTDLLHRVSPDVPIVIGGVEASLRRFTHYDYWSNTIRKSVIADAPADLLVFGMGERPLCEIAKILHSHDGASLPESLFHIPGTVVKRPVKEFKAFQEGRKKDADSFFEKDPVVILPSFAEVSSDRDAFMQAHRLITQHQNPTQETRIVQVHPKTVVVQNPPSFPLSPAELDGVYGLAYKRLPHPSYTESIPAFEMVKDSITSHRGCYGSCSFCAISLHQGRIVQSRSQESILHEVHALLNQRHFSGTVRDIGGATANMYGSWCARWKTKGACTDKECIGCTSLHLNQNGYLMLLDQVARIPQVHHVFIGSGLRYDLLLMEPCVLERITAYISGQMKIAPEHVSDSVLAYMNKPSSFVFKKFIEEFERVQKKHYGQSKKRQYLIPYLMSGHPGCTISDMVGLVAFLHERSMYPEQVQDFTPTPMTTSTAMYYTGLCMSGADVHVPVGEEKQIQRALLGYKDPRNNARVRRGLASVNRLDLLHVLGHHTTH